MQNPKMGGKETLRFFLSGSPDITDSLLALTEAGYRLQQRLQDMVREKYQRAVRAECVQEPAYRSDMLLQQLGGIPMPEELCQHGFGVRGSPASRVDSRLFEQETDIVVFSILPEITQSLWRHAQTGYLFHPLAGWEQEWASPQKQWFLDHCSPTGPISVQQFKENFVRLIRAVKEQLHAHVIVYNCSSVDPDDHTHNYHGLEDTLAVRVQRFNLALLKISGLEGISIIDVDRLIAELGGEKHVAKAFNYSTEACQAICQEFMRVLEDIGFFEDRFLVPQVGKKGTEDAIKTADAIYR